MKKICLFISTILCAIALTGQVSVIQMGTAPTIDGSIGAGEWTNASVALSMSNFQIGSDPGASDISGTVRLAWDATNLYALFQITDDVRGDGSADGNPAILFVACRDAITMPDGSRGFNSYNVHIPLKRDKE